MNVPISRSHSSPTPQFVQEHLPSLRSQLFVSRQNSPQDSLQFTPYVPASHSRDSEIFISMKMISLTCCYIYTKSDTLQFNIYVL